MERVAVETRNLSFHHGSARILHDLNLRIEPGEFFALLGPSGSGKTSLLRILAGFEKASAGHVLIGEHDVGSVPAFSRGAGMVFQNYALWPHLNVYDNVAFGLVERRLPATEIDAKTRAVLDLVGLSAYASRWPSQLSGGEQQRVALARTLAVQPKVLLLDEPLSNLDRRLREDMRKDLKSLQRKLGITTLLVTHDQEEAMTIADRLAVLDRGVLQQVGTAAALFDYPCNRFVADFVGATNLLHGDIIDSSGDTITFNASGVGPIVLPRRADWNATSFSALSFRPHAVRVRVADEKVDDSHVWLQGCIENAEFRGGYARYGIRVGEVRLLADHPHFCGLPMFPLGAQVRLGVQPSQMRLLES